MKKKNEYMPSRERRSAGASTDSVDRGHPAQLCLDNAVMGVDVRVPDPAGGGGWIAATVSLTTITDASDGEILAMGLRTQPDGERRKEPAVPSRPEVRSAVENWTRKHNS